MAINYIVREIEAEAAQLNYAFVGDGLTERGGDWNNNLFIVTPRGYRGFNVKTYEDVQRAADQIIDGFSDVANRDFCYFSSYQDVMQYFEIPYNSRKCHALKEWAKNADTAEPEDIAAYLTITTGKPWNCIGVSGYCQGDYVDVVYCEEHYGKESAIYYGECWLGCAKEFCVIEVDDFQKPQEEDEEATYTEVDSCYGYIVSDSQAWYDEDYKRLVCEWAGIPQEETRLEMIDGYHTYTSVSYRVA